MLDNLEQIKSLLKRDNENEFYYIQVIQRKKDIEWFTWNNRIIKDYYIYSMEQLDKRYDEIKKLCEIFNARAYIRLSRRNSEDIARDMIVSIWESFKNRSYNHLRKIYSTVVWQSVWLDKLWIIDLDWVDIWSWLQRHEYLCSLKPQWEKIVQRIKTKNWIHIITKPFDLQKFKDQYPNIDVHKNNPTILYIYN